MDYTQNLTELRQKKGELANQADEVLKTAAEAKRFDLREDEQKKFDDLHAEIEKLSATITRMEKQQDTQASLTETTGRRTAPNPVERPENRGTLQTSKITSSEIVKTWLRAGAIGYKITSEDMAFAERAGLNLGSNSLTLTLPNTPLRSLAADDIRAYRQSADEQRAALTGAQSTTTTGGYTVADEMMRSLEVALLRFGGMRQVATVLRTSTGGPLPIPTTNDTSQKGRLLSENTGATETEMTFNQLVLDAWKYSSDYVLASVEFMNDTSTNFPAFIGDALATRIARLQNDHFTTGTGSSQPNGVVTAASSGVTGVADPPTYDNIVDLFHTVDPAYRDNARWMMNDSTLKTLKKIKVLQYSGDTTGYPLWSPGLAPGQPNTILGVEYIINQSMASPGSSAKKMLFGDFSKYLIRDVVDVTLLRLDERFAELHQVAFLAFARSDGDLLNAGTNPIKFMSQA